MSDTTKILSEINKKLDSVIDIARQAIPPNNPTIVTDNADTFVWDNSSKTLQPVMEVNRLDIQLLKGIEPVKEILMKNTRQFAKKLPANNTLLWGARGMGKSSLVKSVHKEVSKGNKQIKLVEIHREDINSLPILLNALRDKKQQFIIFCDDLSFDQNDTNYKSLKATLDGGVEGRPKNCIFYATSNRRHLMPRDMIENERSTAITPAEAVEEKVSLSDRFGLWLGFHQCSQEQYLEMINAYVEYYKLGKPNEHNQNALEWSITRGSRSGRVAWQFVTDLAGRKKQKLGD